MAANVDTGRFIEEASVEYTGHFHVSTGIGTFEAMLDDPVLMGRLWEMFECKPAYRISSQSGMYHIIDPSGIEGMLSLIEVSNGARTYIGKGRLKNWYMPVSLKGRALFFLDYTAVGDSVALKFTVYGEKGDTAAIRLLLKAVSPLLRHSIDKRAKQNMVDLNRICRAIAGDPDNIRRNLDIFAAQAFDRLLRGGSGASIISSEPSEVRGSPLSGMGVRQ